MSNWKFPREGDQVIGLLRCAPLRAVRAPVAGVEAKPGEHYPGPLENSQVTAGQPRSTGKVRWEPTSGAPWAVAAGPRTGPIYRAASRKAHGGVKPTGKARATAAVTDPDASHPSARREPSSPMHLPRVPERRSIRACRAKRGALGTFHRHAHWFCLHLPGSSVRREPEYVFELTSTPPQSSGVELE